MGGTEVTGLRIHAGDSEGPEEEAQDGRSRHPGGDMRPSSARGAPPRLRVPGA